MLAIESSPECEAFVRDIGSGASLWVGRFAKFGEDSIEYYSFVRHSEGYELELGISSRVDELI
jgi:hypothetical protein